MKKGIGLVLLAALLTGCAADPQFVKQLEVPQHETIGVIPFRDCMIEDQEDCRGSGATAGNVFAQEFSGDGYRSVLLSRPVGPRDGLSDQAAVELARGQGLAFVMNGEVTEFYSVAPMTFRADRAGVSLRILRVEDGKIALSWSHARLSSTNFSTPEGLLEDMAEDVREELEE